VLESPAFLPAFLDVEASATGRRWLGPSPEDDRLGAAIAQAAGLPEVVGRVLARRGVPPAEATAHLAPALRDLLPDPSRLIDMDVAAERFVRAVRGAERIAVFADYDVDGGASAALILSWLRDMGREATLYVPDRIEEGYGPNVPAMAQLGAVHDLIVCVDCGTLSHEPIAAAGCDVIVLDHHLGGETLPPAVAVVNPNRQDESGDLGYLCAAGVVFLMLVAANRLLRQAGERGPELIPLLDLVALATVADVAPLVGLNRALVRQGLAVMAGGLRPGIGALAAAAGLTGAPSAYGLGFVLGPRVNAGGRVGRADLGARLLAATDAAEAAALAGRLETLNAERRAIEAAVRVEAEAQAAARAEGPLVWAAGEGWHPGVVGIVAARLKESFGRPAVVIGFRGDEGKGSGRSVAGVDLGAAVARLAREGLIARGGGHRMAAGVSLSRAELEPAMARLGALLAAEGAGDRPARGLRVDGLIAAGGATPELATAIASAGPYGAGAPAPRLAVAGARLMQVRRVGEGHLALALGDRVGGRLEAVAFRAFEGPLGAFLEARAGAPVHLAGRLERDDWNGRARVKLHVEDAAEGEARGRA
jgi:single-stranded-DNA-specific exonuclease